MNRPFAWSTAERRNLSQSVTKSGPPSQFPVLIHEMICCDRLCTTVFATIQAKQSKFAHVKAEAPIVGERYGSNSGGGIPISFWYWPASPEAIAANSVICTS